MTAPMTFTVAEFIDDPTAVVSHAARFGKAVVVDSAGTPRVVCTIPGQEPEPAIMLTDEVVIAQRDRLKQALHAVVTGHPELLRSYSTTEQQRALWDAFAILAESEGWAR